MPFPFEDNLSFAGDALFFGFLRLPFPFEANLGFAGDALFFGFLDALSVRGDETDDKVPGGSIARFLRGRPRFLLIEVVLSLTFELATRSRFSPSVVNTELASCFCFLLPFEGSRRIVGGESTSRLLRDLLGLDVELEHSPCFSFSFEDLRRLGDALFFVLKDDFVS